MFSLNGIDLTDDARGWAFSYNSQPLSALAFDRVALTRPGRDGVLPLPAGARAEAPALPLEVVLTKSGLDALAALFGSPALLLDWDGREVDCELMSFAPLHEGGDGEVVTVAILLRLSSVYWRDPAVTTSAAIVLGANSVNVDVLAGLTGPVRDAIVRVAGGCSDLRLTGGDGSWIAYPTAIADGDYLRIDTESGRAWLTSTDTWTGGTEVTGLLNNGPGSYPLSIIPTFTDPAVRVGRIVVTSTARTTASIEVRGRRAFSV